MKMMKCLMALATMLAISTGAQAAGSDSYGPPAILVNNLGSAVKLTAEYRCGPNWFGTTTCNIGVHSACFFTYHNENNIDGSECFVYNSGSTWYVRTVGGWCGVRCFDD